MHLPRYLPNLACPHQGARLLSGWIRREIYSQQALLGCVIRNEECQKIAIWLEKTMTSLWGVLFSNRPIIHVKALSCFILKTTFQCMTWLWVCFRLLWSTKTNPVHLAKTMLLDKELQHKGHFANMWQPVQYLNSTTLPLHKVEKKCSEAVFFRCLQGAKFDSSQKKQRQTKLQTKSSVITKYLMAISILSCRGSRTSPLQTILGHGQEISTNSRKYPGNITQSERNQWNSPANSMTFPEFSQKHSPRLSDGRIHHIVMPNLLQLMASRPGESHPHLSIGQTYANLGKSRNKNHISEKKHDKTPRIREKVSNICGEIPALAHISPESIEK